MAKPRIFISSTFFDLRQVRTDLERFIKELGYEAVRNETGGITYGKDSKLEEYCYKEISEIDILVGIVGGKFGSQSENGDYSITQTEIKTAIDQNKQIYIFVEKNVLGEYETYLINKENESIKYKFVDDKRIYKFIEELYSLPKNNIIHPFETVQEIILFLKEQWAGVFRDLLMQQTRKGQYENITSKVNELTEVASTIKTYLENVLENVSKEKSGAESLITQERERLEKFHQQQSILDISYLKHLIKDHELDYDIVIENLKTKNTFAEFRQSLIQLGVEANDPIQSKYSCMLNERAVRDLNKGRELLGVIPYVLSNLEKEDLIDKPSFYNRKKPKSDSDVKT